MYKLCDVSAWCGWGTGQSLPGRLQRLAEHGNALHEQMSGMYEVLSQCVLHWSLCRWRSRLGGPADKVMVHDFGSPGLFICRYVVVGFLV